MRPLSHAMNACSKAFFTLLLAGTACATVQAAPATAADITTLFTDALHCRIEFPDGRDEALAQRLRAQGVTVVDRAPGESLDLLYLFATPLEIDGTQVSSITVRGGSGRQPPAHSAMRCTMGSPRPLPCSWGRLRQKRRVASSHSSALSPGPWSATVNST